MHIHTYKYTHIHTYIYIYIQSKLDNSTLTGRSFHVELASMLSYRMYNFIFIYNGILVTLLIVYYS